MVKDYVSCNSTTLVTPICTMENNPLIQYPTPTSFATYRRKRVSSKKGDLVPSGHEYPLGRELREFWEILLDVLSGPHQNGLVLSFPVMHLPCTPVIYVCPESSNHTPVIGDGESHWCKLRHFFQKGNDSIVVDLDRRKK